MQTSDRMPIMLRSDRQTVRSHIKALLASSEFAPAVQDHDAADDGASIIIYDASQQPYAQAEAGIGAVASRGAAVLVIANASSAQDGWSMEQRAKLRNLGKVNIAPWGIEKDELILRLKALLLQSQRLSILIIEDDPRIAKEVSYILTEQGYAASIAADIDRARTAIRERPFALLIVDRNLPGGQDGLDFVRSLRAAAINTPALMVTARIEASSRIEGLRAGANDYMCKPFDPGELLARVDILLQPAQAARLVRFGKLELNLADRVARWAGSRIDMTDTEFDLLGYLGQRADLTLPPAMLLTDIWNNIDRFSESNVVATAIRRLRRKLEETGVPSVIITEERGYRFDYSRLLLGDAT